MAERPIRISTAETRPPLAENRRTALLDYELAAWTNRGYRIIVRTPTTAQLLKPKHFSGLWATFWLLMFGVGLIFYVIYHLSKSEQAVYLIVDEDGLIRQIG